LLAILAKNIAIAIAILSEKSIAILIRYTILFSKSVLQYYCNTFGNTSLSSSRQKVIIFTA